MRDITQQLLQRADIDPVYRAAMPPRELLDLSDTRIIAALRKPHRDHAVRVLLEHRAYRV